MIITSAGKFGSPKIKGANPSKMQDDVALRVATIGTVEFDNLNISHCGICIRHDSAKLKIRTLSLSDFTADAINTFGSMDIYQFNVNDNIDFAYSGNYHKDAGFQAFNFKTKIVKDITIKNIKARIKGLKTQFIMLSEPDHRHTGINICKGGIADIRMTYKYAFVANQLDTSYINVGKNGIKIKKVKPTPHHCFNVVIKAYKGQLIVLDEFYVKRGAFKYEKGVMSKIRARHIQKLLKIKADGDWNVKSQYALELFGRELGVTLNRAGVVPFKVYLKLIGWGNEANTD